jgi:hypothetical protein
MGWTQFLVHGVPIWDDENYNVFGPQAILKEARTLPGLKRAVFAMQPRWLRPVENIESPYSSITFAVSDPNGTITSTLLSGRSALFGKEVTVRKWIDKPALVQCSRCHALGHNKASKACPLGKDSVKCYHCRGAHRSEKHDQHCACKHAVAGICDCGHFKCLNCHKPGHNCRDIRCPARDLYRPRGIQKTGKTNGKGKENNTTPAAAQTPNSDGDLYGPPLLNADLPPANPASPTQTDYERMEEYERMECKWNKQPDHVGSYTDPLAKWNAYEQPTGWGSPTLPSQPRAYSPSRPAGDTNPLNHA